jgi:hypothetical protein
METTRKAWTSPNVFVLGIEGTQAGVDPALTETFDTKLVCEDDGDGNPINCETEYIMRFPQGLST